MYSNNYKLTSYSCSAYFDGFSSLWSCVPKVKCKNPIPAYSAYSYDTRDYIQNINPCKT